MGHQTHMKYHTNMSMGNKDTSAICIFRFVSGLQASNIHSL